MMPFAGFDMPVQYAGGALGEYHAVRNGGAGLFDISHMGQVRITGTGALAFLQYVTTNDVSRLTDGQVQYAALLNEAGGFIDDITTYRISATEYYLCINAANRQQDVAHLIREAARFDVVVTDESDDTALLALQGGAAQAILQKETRANLDEIGYYRFRHVKFCGSMAMLSRTGYTGEDGFEIYLPADSVVTVWRALLDAGATPAGQAARDMLRTEMGYALYGHEISESVTPVEAGLMWIVRIDKGAFIGRDAVLARQASGPESCLIGLKLADRGIPRADYPVVWKGRKAGEVTSGIFSPLAGCGVALARVSPDAACADSLAVEIRGKLIPALRTKPPFVRSNVRK